MNDKWINYYSEIFRTYSSEFFLKLWGDSLDEYGEEYENVYRYELNSMKSEFACFMLLFNEYKIDYSRDAIAMKIIEMFEMLGRCDYPTNAWSMADMIILSINRRIGFNDTWHPKGRPI